MQNPNIPPKFHTFLEDKTGCIFLAAFLINYNTAIKLQKFF